MSTRTRPFPQVSNADAVSDGHGGLDTPALRARATAPGALTNTAVDMGQLNDPREDYRLLSVCVIAGILISVTIVVLEPFGWTRSTLVQFLKTYVYWPASHLFGDVVFSWGFAIALTLTLALERLLPADRDHKVFGPSFLQDSVWFLYEASLQVAVLSTYGAAVAEVYQRHFAFLTIEAAADWPIWLRFGLGMLLLDFLFWLQHLINHKVTWLWYFHMVHHSQKDLSFFTDFRYHVVEYLVRQTLIAIPLLIVGFQIPTIVWFALFQSWYTRFYHGNIRANMWPLCYILVTPQSHRVHHSVEVRHHDKNFGSLLSCWDFLFGTQYRGFDEYPRTGVTHHDFPHERSIRLVSLIVTPIRQMLYPFKRIIADVRLKWLRSESRTPHAAE